jgi:putative transposase
MGKKFGQTRKKRDRAFFSGAGRGTMRTMPRTARASEGGLCYHALNRGNLGATVFQKPADYDAFVESMTDASARLPLDLLGYCLLPNHVHLVVRPHGDGDLGRWVQWLLTAHARRYHRQFGTSGHVWQGRFKSFPVQDGDHLRTVLRYVERNPVRARLVKRAENWRWSSLAAWLRRDRVLWRGRPPLRGRNWAERINEPLSPADLERLRHAVVRGKPFGDEAWIRETAVRLGLESCLRPRGRPRKEREPT